MADDKLLQCYNRGCGKKYELEENNEDSCQHHPGEPFFHDAYKGWSCCNKKCIDFTEFLDIKGCTLSKHSNIKPPEPEKPVVNDEPDTEIVEVKPIIQSAMERPPIDTPLVTIVPEIAPSLKQLINSGGLEKTEEKPSNPDEVALGTICKNGACNVTYLGPETNNTTCQHHPGVPIFHEGMKYWSCCQKKTSDFNSFLAQLGCEHGTHVWNKESTGNTINCRWDHHQTASHVVVSIYAKQYCPTESTVKLNPIRLCVHLVFPQESDSTFDLDLELRGIVDVQASQVSMYGTKVEIKLKKAETGSWARLGTPKAASAPVQKNECPTVAKIIPVVDAVDLSDL